MYAVSVNRSRKVGDGCWRSGRERRKGGEKRNDNKKADSSGRRGPRYQLKSSLRSAILLSEVSLRLDSDSSRVHLVLSRASPSPHHAILSASLLFFPVPSVLGSAAVRPNGSGAYTRRSAPSSLVPVHLRMSLYPRARPRRSRASHRLDLTDSHGDDDCTLAKIARTATLHPSLSIAGTP